MFYRKINEDRNKLIASEVNWVIPNFESNKVLYTTKDDTLYISNLKDESKRIADDVMKYRIVGNSLYYYNNDGTLYHYDFTNDPVEVAAFVENFQTSENNTVLAYCNDKREIFLLKGSQEGNKVIKDANKYTKVYLSNRLVFEKLLRINDIAGFWQLEYSNEVFEITEDGKLIAYFDDGITEKPIKVEGYTESEGSIIGSFRKTIERYYDGTVINENQQDSIDDEYDYMGYVWKINDDLIEIDGERLIRISRETFDKRVDELKEAFALSKKIGELYVLGYNLWQTWVELPTGTEVRESPRLSSELTGTIPTTEKFYVNDYYVDEEANLWLEIGNYYEYSWVLYKSEANNAI